MKRLLSLAVVFLVSSCGTQKVVETKPKFSFPREKKQSVQRTAKKKTELKAELNGVPAKYALKAFCLERKLTCDLSSLPDDKLKVSLHFSGSPQEFLKLIHEKTGISFKKVGNVYVFSAPETITIKAVNLPLGQFLQIVAEKLKGYSIVTGRGVNLATPVTVLAENQPVDLVLKQALSNLGYEVNIDRARKVIEIKGWVSKILSLPSFFSNAKTASLNSSASVYGGSGSGSNTSSSLQMAFLQGMKIEFENTIRNILTGNGQLPAGQQGRFSVNYDLGELYVEGRAEDVKKVEDYLRSLKKKLDKQVLVDIAIVEQRLDDSTTYGVDWSKVLRGLDDKKIKISQSSLGATQGVLNIEIDGASFSSVLKAIQNTGKAKVITNFRLSVPNYDVAVLASAVTRQFITQVQRDVNPQTGRETWATTTQQVSEGSALFVRPVIRDDGKVDIVIAPTISSILGVESQQFGDITLQNPIVAQRNAPLRLVVKPDRTYVVGGVLTSSVNNNKSGIPYLTELPLIGGVFGRTEKTKRDSIIYVVLRTHVEEK